MLQLFFHALCFPSLVLDAVVTRDDNGCWGLGRRAGRRNGREKVHDALQRHEQWVDAEACELIVTERITTKKRCWCLCTADKACELIVTERITTKKRCWCLCTADTNIRKVVENVTRFTLRYVLRVRVLISILPTSVLKQITRTLLPIIVGRYLHYVLLFCSLPCTISFLISLLWAGQWITKV